MKRVRLLLAVAGAVLVVATLLYFAWPRVEPPVVVDTFARLKNDADPTAATLLEDEPAVPAEPVAADEARRLDAAFYLRGPLQIRGVRPLSGGAPGAPRFLLLTKGAAESKPLRVRSADGVDAIQRTAYNPDIVVEVRDGRIYAVEARLTLD